MTNPFTRPDAPAEPPGGVRFFYAEDQMECTCCGSDIFPGEAAGYIDGDTDASCAGCCDDAEGNDCV
ncbi:hypothetical protein [Streptomyces sp. NPDC059009]|uniref:hypothetical protein n=1 Tax=Streptomyces sp. NPDC059009 TaxID=3346694 RepID=UPI0036B2D19C